MAVWCAADRSGDGDASGMSDPEVCISGGAGSGGIGGMAGEEVRMKNVCVIGIRKRIRKTSSYSLTCSASHLQVIISKTEASIVL